MPIRVKRYFLNVLRRTDHETPNGPSRGASGKNLQLKYTNYNILDKLYRMQVLMIQSVPPYTAWPIRRVFEMDADFLYTTSEMANKPLEWTGTVHSILEALSLGSPLSNFARLTTPGNEITPYAKKIFLTARLNRGLYVQISPWHQIELFLIQYVEIT
ncbi:hypothetical protein K3495_g3434 [Podosphaera aphanis]|nr:hypothetical protein K3495_g3434 [Podosphaera aphanis]